MEDYLNEFEQPEQKSKLGKYALLIIYYLSKYIIIPGNFFLGLHWLTKSINILLNIHNGYVVADAVHPIILTIVFIIAGILMMKIIKNESKPI